jgi:poly(A) polymerase
MTDREFATDVVRRLRDAGFEALWAGGCVRDELLGHSPEDYDVATNARPEQVRGAFRRTIEVGASFGVIEVIGPKLGDKYMTVQVATFRSDVSYSDGRRPDAVKFCSAEEDAKRRDFTINGMFFDPLENKLIDYVGGQADLHSKLLRAIGDPHARFTEDKLRLLRAVRFAARFKMAIEPATLAAIREMSDQITVVSAERIADELRKLLADPERVRALQLMAETGVLAAILPEVAQKYGMSDGQWQSFAAVVGHLPRSAGFLLSFAAMLHDVASTPIQASVIAETVATRLRLSNSERACIAWLVDKHTALNSAQSMRMSILKPLLASVHIPDLFDLHRAIARAQSTGVEHVEFAENKLKEWTASGELNPPPLITGNDLHRLGLTPGPGFKQFLDAVRDAQLDGTISTSAEALALVDQLRRS